MKKNNFFKSERWDAGIQNKLDGALGREFDQPSEVEAGTASGALQAVLVPVADVALTYYDKRIRAFFARAGIDIGADVLTVDAIKRKVEASTGLEIQEFTEAGLLDAIERPVARQVSELMGFAVTKVFDQVEFKRQVKDHVLQRLTDGEGGGVLKGATLHRLRDAATWAQSGQGAGERRRVLNRAYQRKFRRSNRQTWTGS